MTCAYRASSGSPGAASSASAARHSSISGLPDGFHLIRGPKPGLTCRWKHPRIRRTLEGRHLPPRLTHHRRPSPRRGIPGHRYRHGQSGPSRRRGSERLGMNRRGGQRPEPHHRHALASTPGALAPARSPSKDSLLCRLPSNELGARRGGRRNPSNRCERHSSSSSNTSGNRSCRAILQYPSSTFCA